MRRPTAAPRGPGAVLRAHALVTLLTLATLAAVLGVPAVPSVATTQPTTTQPADTPAVVVVGTGGLRWDDVRTLATPALWDMSRDASLGTLAARSVRSSACPADGWLALSAGARAADLPGEAYGECRRLVHPGPEGEVPGWAAYVESAEGSSFAPRLGLLGETLATEGVPATGIGPGAAVALADADGTAVGTHHRLPTDPERLRTLTAEALESSDLVVVDVGVVRDPGRALVSRGEELPVEPPPPSDGEAPSGPEVITEPTRAQQVQPIDERVGAVLDAVRSADRPVTVLVVSLSDSGTRARLQLVAALGDAPGAAMFGDSLLGSRSTRQPGIVQATDLTPTVLGLLGLADDVPGGALVGSPLRPVPGPDTANARLDTVVDLDVHSAAVRPVTPTFYTVLIVLNLVLHLAVSLGLNGRVLAAADRLRVRLSQRSTGLRGRVGGRVGLGLLGHPTGVLQTLRAAGVVVGSLPVAGLLANLVPWWRAASPGWAVIGTTAAFMALVSAAALLPRWRNPLLGPAGVVAGLTALVIGIDVALGAPLQVSAPMGVQPVVAGRFYGMNNTSFALFAASSLVASAVLVDPLVRAGRRRLAAVVVAVVGVVVTVLDGLPGLGSDFGGPPALVPGFAVLALMTAGVRLSWFRLLGVLAAGAAVVTAFALLDWLRPAADRTHLGRFVDTVLDGGLSDVVGRKLAQNLDNLGGSWLTLLALGGIALVALVLVRPLRWAASAPDGGPFGWLSSGAPLTSLGADVPLLRPLLTALAVTLGIGFAVNDSGIVVPALGISVAVPLLVTISADWLLQLRRRVVGAQPREGRTLDTTP